MILVEGESQYKYSNFQSLVQEQKKFVLCRNIGKGSRLNIHGVETR